MKKTTNLQLPIYDNPSVDVFKLVDWNTANQKLEDTFVRVANNYEEALALSSENANLELVDARNGKGSLGELTRDITSSLAEIKNQVYNVKDYGAKGDGITDDSEAILRAVASMRKNNVELYFPPGIYIHGDGVTTNLSYEPSSEDARTPIINSNTVNIGRDIRIILENFNNIVVNGYGAEIRSNDKNGECRNNAIMKFIDCKNVVVKGLNFNGRRQERGAKFNDYSIFDSGERGNLHIYRCENIVVTDVESINAMMDGMCVYSDNTTPSINIEINNCICNHNYRQGLTISMVEKCNINGGHYSYNGYGGTMPKSGIDIEADWGGIGNKHININGTYFVDNAVSNLIFAAGLDGCTVINCYFEKKSLAAHSSAKDITIKDCRFNDCSLAGSVNINYFNNICEYSPNDFLNNEVTHIILDYSDAINPYDVVSSYFSGNKIICDLSNVPIDFRGRVGFIRTTTSIPLVFENNIIVNSLDCTGTYVFMLNGCKSLTGNMFIYNNDIEFTNKTNVIQGLFRKDSLSYRRISTDNVVVGYNDSQFSYGLDNVIELDGKQISTVNFENDVANSLYKINTQFVTEVVARNYYNKINTFNIHYDVGTVKATNNSGGAPHANLYIDNSKNYYIYLLEDYQLIEVINYGLGFGKKLKSDTPCLTKTNINVNTLTKVEFTS